MLVVGSVALWLHGIPVTISDLDVVVDPEASNLARTRDALVVLGARSGRLASPRSLQTSEIVTAKTAFGSVDLMLETGRRELPVLKSRAVDVHLYDVVVPVASRSDTLSLRSRFKAERSA